MLTCLFFLTKYCVFTLHQFSNNSRCHWVVCVSALMGKGKENGKFRGGGKVFLPSTCPECLEWLYSLHQIAVCIYKIYFLFKSVYFWGKTFSFCLFGSGVSGMKVHIAPGHLALQEGQDWGIMGNMLSCVFFFFYVCFYLLIDLLCCHLVWD